MPYHMFTDKPATATRRVHLLVLLDRKLRHFKRWLRLRKDILYAYAAGSEC